MSKLNILLLSGGMGKRLWPLTNQYTGKQYLKFLMDDKGNPESMIQRIYRQIRFVYLEANVVVITNEKQKSFVKEQLGEDVPIVIEPDARDTYPAIFLGVAYMHFVQKKNKNEAIIIIPVDAYVDMAYFQKFVDMESVLKRKDCRLVLMGITPKYASSKFGYILSEQEELEYGCHIVSRFLEKPSKEKAEELIQKGAKWNAGVFAFRLEYLLKRNAEIHSFEASLEKFMQMPKRSFDYEVVEHEEKAVMCVYNDIWSDLGTWDEFLENTDCSRNGKVILDRCLFGIQIMCWSRWQNECGQSILMNMLDKNMF